MNEFHKFIGFYKVNNETKAVYFEKSTRRYKILETNSRVMVCKNPKENYEVYYGMNWRYVNEDELEVIFND